MKKINKTQYAVLGWLAKGPLSGYDLKKQFSTLTPLFWNETNAQIYPVLKKLEDAKMVSSRKDSKSGARERRVYMISSAGMAHLEKWLTDLPAASPSREEALLKLVFSERAPVEDALNLIKHLKREAQAGLDLIAKVATRIETDFDGRPDELYLQLANHYSREMAEAKLKWCKEAAKQLRGHL
jgi:PadR family transcriptional regulator AphA